MAPKYLVNWVGTFFLLTISFAVAASSFTSGDKAFTLDVPAGWKSSTTPLERSVLSIEKGSSRIDIKTIDCTTETCLEERINNDLADIKRKKMQVVGNSYTGEDIKRIEFSTGEPFFYISFFTPKNDFGAGYFLINNQGYSILARNLSYAETDLIFSFISPVVATESPAPSLEVNLQDPRAYSTTALPPVTEVELDAAEPPHFAPNAVKSRSFAGWKLKQKLSKLRINTLISQRMPPYIRQLGHGFDGLILLGCLYMCILGGAWLLRLWIRPGFNNPPANPNSLYPIRFVRLYGTPSLIFRAKDNQGNILISLSSRWDSLFMFSGLLLVFITCVALAIFGILEQGKLVPLSTFTYDTLYAVCSLLIPLGFVIFFCGVIWSQLILREINLFDRRGKKAAVILQKGFGLKQERYEIYFARSKEILIVTRKRFSWRRTWAVFNSEHQLLATLQETSGWRALGRKLFGHLWGFLRADYHITGQMDSTGAIINDHAAFNGFTCQLDKPQAIAARDLLVTSLLINIRDKDKWYPWFN